MELPTNCDVTDNVENFKLGMYKKLLLLTVTLNRKKENCLLLFYRQFSYVSGRDNFIEYQIYVNHGCFKHFYLNFN